MTYQSTSKFLPEKMGLGLLGQIIIFFGGGGGILPLLCLARIQTMAQANSPDMLPRHVKKVPLGMITGQYLLHVWGIGSTLLAFRPGGEETLLAASCYRNWDKFWQLRASGSYADFTFTLGLR